jgi:eukaryotic-like serine/threonine-protein kinase
LVIRLCAPRLQINTQQYGLDESLQRSNSLKISAPDWQQAFKLLDAALEIPAAERVAWLKNLGPEHAHLQPALAELLEQHAALETESFLQSLPAFTNVDLLPGDAASSTLSGQSGGLGDKRLGELKADVSIGPYRLIRELGVGGMGAVWLAERSDGSLKRTVALKLPHAGPFQRQLAERFDRERDILAALTHPNIARLYDAGAGITGQPYLALEYVEGLPLTEYCTSKNLGVRERLELFGQVLSAVQYAHNNLVLHRDLKPSNILVTATGTVSLLDFGIAKFMTGATTSETALTELTGRAMTPDYASPEQIAGAPISTSSDVYSLGVVLYELLTGVRPYKLKRGTRGELEDAILAVDAIRPSQMMRQRTGVHDTVMFKTAKQLDGDLDTVCLKALKKKPEERYATVAAFANDITRWLNGYPIETRSDGSWYVVRKYVARHRTVVVLSSLALFAMVAGTVVSVIQAQRASAEAEVAREQSARAQAVEQFLSSLFKENSVDQADPEAARRITAPELLDRGAARIDKALVDFPDAKADVIATLANMYVHLGDWKKAADLNATRLPLVEKSHGKQSIEYAQALIDAADKLKGTLKDDETVLAFTTEAKQILTSLRREKSLQFAEVLRFESIIWRRSDLDKAVDTAAQAVEIIRPFVSSNSLLLNGKAAAGASLANPASGASDAAKAANEQARNIAKRFSTALGDLGMTYNQRGNYIEADEALTEAMNLLARTRGIDNFDTAWVVMLKGSIDVMRGNFVEAEPRLRDGTRNVLRTGGLQQPASVYAESMLAWFLHMTGRRDEAKELIDTARTRIAVKLGPTHQRVVEANLTYAGMLINEGRFAEAIAIVEPYTKIKNRSPANANIVLGAALAQSGETDRARALLDAGISIQEARKARNNIWWIEGMLARAELSLAERDYAAAKADFNSISGGAIANDLGAQYTARIHLGLARAEAAQGDVAAAQSHLKRADALLNAPEVNGLLVRLSADVKRETETLKQPTKK